MVNAQENLNTMKFEEMLNELASLQLADLEQFVKKATQLLERRKNPKFSEKENQLIRQIKNGGPSEVFWKKYDVLAAQMEERTISEVDRQELIRLTEVVENWSVERLKLMIELSKLWDCPLEDILTHLDISPRERKYA